MFRFLNFEKKSYCHIWGMEKNGNNLSAESQICFNAAMEDLELQKKGLKEDFLITRLRQIAEEINLNIYYHLNSKKIFPTTLITYQESINPRKDKVIKRF